MKIPHRLIRCISIFWFLSLASHAVAEDFGTIRPDLSEDIQKNFHTARVDIRKGLYSKAVERLDHVIRLQPKLITAYLERGRAHKKLGKTEPASRI